MAAALAATLVFDAAFSSLALAKQSDGVWHDRRRTDAAPAQLAALPAALDAPLVIPSSLRASAIRLVPSAPPALARVIDALPATAGDVRSLDRSAKGSRVVVHIQDIHANDEAQANIRAAVKSLLDKGGVTLVGLEGAFAPIDLGRLRSYRRPETVRRVADYLLAEHQISGAVRAGIESTSAGRFVGIDDAALHEANKRAFLAASPEAERLRAALAQSRRDLDAKKAAAFPAELARFDRVMTAYRDGETPITDYVKQLAGFTDGLSPRLQTFAAAAELEDKIDFDRVEEERARVLTKLVSVLSKDALADLLARGTAYRAGALRHADFYGYLRSLCSRHGIDLARTPAMDDYVRYVQLSDAIDANRLLGDVEAVENEAIDRLAAAPAHRALVDEGLRLHLTGKLLGFSLTNDEWRRYRALSGASGALGAEALAPFEDFYRVADKRDAAMAERFARELDRAGDNAAVLVTGGFHARGIEEALARRGLQIVTFVPALTKVDETEGSAYLSVFARERAPLDRLFDGPQLFLSPPPALVHEAAGLGAAIDHADGPQLVADAIAPEADVAVSLVSAREETATTDAEVTVDAVNRRTGFAQRIRVVFNREKIVSVFTSARSGAGAWLRDVRLSWRIRSGLARMAIADALSGAQEPKRAFMALMAALFFAQAMGSGIPAVNATPLSPQTPAPIVRMVDSFAPAPPVRVTRAPAPRPAAKTQAKPAAKPSAPVQNAKERRKALRQAKSELQRARVDRQDKVSAAQRAVDRVKSAIAALQSSIQAREKAERDAKQQLERLQRQLAEIQARLAAPAFKTAVPAAAVRSTSESLAKGDWAARAADVAALRNDAAATGLAGTEAGGAIDVRLTNAESILTGLADASAELEALNRRLATDPTLSPEQSAALAERLSDIKGRLEEAGDVATLVSEAQDAATRPGGIPEAAREAFSKRAQTVVDAVAPAALEPMARAVNALSGALVNLDSLRAEEEGLRRREAELKRQSQRLEARIASAPTAKYYDLDGDALADEIGKIGAGRPLAELAQEARYRLEALNPAGGNWGASLGLAADALETLAEAQEQLRDPTLTPEEKIVALTAAARAIAAVQSAAPAFIETINAQNDIVSPVTEDDRNRKNPLPSELLNADARRSFESFKSRLIRDNPLYKDAPQNVLIALWYGEFLRLDIGAGFAGVTLDEAIARAQASIRNGLNLRSRAESSADAAEREAARRQSSRDEAARLAKAVTDLDSLRKDIAAEAKKAAALAPTVQTIGADFRPPVDRMDRLAKALDAVAARPIKFKGPEGESLRALLSAVRDDARRLADGKVSDADAAMARARLSELISRIDDLVNPAVVSYDGKDLEALTTFMRELVNAGVLWLAGIADERIKAGVTGEDTYEDRALRAALALTSGPTDALAARRNLEQLKKQSKWGIFDLLEGINIFMGLMSLQQNFDTFMGKKAPVAFRVERFPKYWEGPVYDEKSIIPPLKGPQLLLAGVNALVAAKGAVSEMRVAFSGDKPDRVAPYFIATLFPEAFNDTTWEILENGDAAEQPGWVYYRTSGFAMRAQIGRKEGRMTWQPVRDRSETANRIYRVRNGVYEIMAAGKDSVDLEERVKRGTRAVQAIQQVIGFAGSFRARIVSPTPTFLTRFQMGLNIIGTGSALLQFWDRAEFKRTLRSTYGGWVTSPDPAFSARMRVIYPPDPTRPGQPRDVVEMGAMRENGALLVKRGKVWETPDGTPVYTIGTGRWKFKLSLTRIRLWRSAERFQVSVREAEKATAEEGTFVRRRSNSAPVTVVAENDNLYLQTQVFGRPVRYLLGEKADSVPVDGQTVTARPYYAVESNGEPGALQGVVIGDAGLRPGDTVSYKNIFSYVGSLPEKLAALLVQLGVEEWYDLNPLEARFVRPDIPAYPGAGWAADLDGIERFRGPNAAGENTTLFIRFSDSQGTFVLDMEKQILYRFSLDASGALVLTGVKGVSLPALALTKERESAEGQWLREGKRRGKRPTDSSLRGFPSDVEVWFSPAEGTVYVSKPLGATFPGIPAEAGTYRFRLGGQGARNAQEATTHPFYTRQPMPLAPALPDGPGALRNTRTRPDGTTETWVSVNRLYTDAKRGETREVAEVWVEYTENGVRRVDRVVTSTPGYLYDQDVADEARPWNRRLLLPELAWIDAPVPPSIRPYVPAGAAQTQIARDAKGRMYFRIVMADGRVFGFEAGTSPEELRAEADRILNGGVDALSPLPDGVDPLMERLGDREKNDFKRGPDGRWYYVLPTVAAVSERIDELLTGRYARVRNRTLAQLTESFARDGLTLRSAGEPIPFGGLMVTPHLAFEQGRTSPSVVIVIVEEGGLFVHPETPNAPPVRLEKGDILQLEAGAIATAQRRERLSSPIPFLDRIFMSPAAIDRLSGDPLVARGAGRLPALFGAGAQNIRGTWFAREAIVDGEKVTTEYYFRADNDGVITDPKTGAQVRVEANSIWVVERTRAGAERYADFNNGRQPGWTVRVGPSTLPQGGVPFAVTGPNGARVPGRVFLPTKDQQAPLFVVELPAGQTAATVDDALAGPVAVATGDVLVFQWPAGFQQASIDALGASERLYLPSLVGRESIAKAYAATPEAGNGPRALVAGRAAPGLIPGFPADVPLIVWLDPNNPDGPVVVEVESVPGPRTWVHPQLGVAIPLEAGTTFVRAATALELAREKAQLENEDRAFLAEGVWDLDSTLLNARRRFNARTDAAAQWRRRENKATPWSFNTKVGGLRATVIEDIGNENSAYLNPALDLVIFHEEGIVNGVRVRPGVVYRRRSSLRSAERHRRRLGAWGVGYPVSAAGEDVDPITFNGPVLTGRRSLHPSRPFFDDGRPNLVRRVVPGREVNVVRRNGRVYVVEGTPPSDTSTAIVYLLKSGQGVDLKNRSFSSPSFGGLVRAMDLPAATRARVQARARELTGGTFDLSPSMMVRLGADGEADAIVELGLPAREWSDARQADLGRVQMFAGSRRTRLLRYDADKGEVTVGPVRTLAGWVGIGNQPGFMSIEDAQLNSEPVNGRNGDDGWYLIDAEKNRIGTIIFGDKAPKIPTFGLATITDLKTRVSTPLLGKRFDVPAFSGLRRFDSLTPEQKTQVRNLLLGTAQGTRDPPGGLLVRFAPDGRPEAIVTLRPEAERWAAQRRKAYGYIQMDPGVGPVEFKDVEGKRTLNGWVAIGPRGGLGPRQVTENLVFANGRNSDDGLVLVDKDGRRVGIFVEGDKPLPARRPFIAPVRPPAPRADNGRLTYIRPEALTPAVEKNLRPVVQIIGADGKPGDFVWAAFINGAWRKFEDPDNDGQWIADATGPALRVAGSPTADRHPRGEVDAAGQVTRIVSNEKPKPGRRAPVVSGKSPWKVQSIRFDQAANESHVTLKNVNTDVVAVDTYQAEQWPAFRTYMSIDQAGRPLVVSRTHNTYDARTGRTSSAWKEDRDPSNGRWIRMEEYKTLRNKEFTYPANSPARGQRVRGEILIAYQPGTNREISRTFIAEDDGRTVWTQVEYSRTLMFYGPNGRPSEQWRYDLNPAIEKYENGRRVPRRTGLLEDNLDGIEPVGRVAILSTPSVAANQTQPTAAAPVTAPPAPAAPARVAQSPRRENPVTRGARSIRDLIIKGGIGVLIMSAFSGLGLMVVNNRSGGGNDDGGLGRGDSDGGEEADLARRVVAALRVLAETRASADEEAARAQALDALLDVFEGAPLDQDLASVDGRVDGLLGAFRGEGFDGPKFNAAFKREMEAEFGRELPLDEAFGLAHELVTRGAAVQDAAQVVPAELSDAGAALVIVTEAMRPRLAQVLASTPKARDGKRVVFVAENDDLRAAIAAARPDATALNGAAAFVGSALSRDQRLQLSGLESVLSAGLSDNFFESVSNLVVISPYGLPVETGFDGEESGVLRDLLRQAVFVLINEQLQAVSLTHGTLESIGELARLISTQA